MFCLFVLVLRAALRVRMCLFFYLSLTATNTTSYGRPNFSMVWFRLFNFSVLVWFGSVSGSITNSVSSIGPPPLCLTKTTPFASSSFPPPLLLNNHRPTLRLTTDEKSSVSYRELVISIRNLNNLAQSQPPTNRPHSLRLQHKRSQPLRRYPPFHNS